MRVCAGEGQHEAPAARVPEPVSPRSHLRPRPSRPQEAQLRRPQGIRRRCRRLNTRCAPQPSCRLRRRQQPPIPQRLHRMTQRRGRHQGLRPRSLARPRRPQPRASSRADRLGTRRRSGSHEREHHRRRGRLSCCRCGGACHHRSRRRRREHRASRRAPVGLAWSATRRARWPRATRAAKWSTSAAANADDTDRRSRTCARRRAASGPPPPNRRSGRQAGGSPRPPARPRAIALRRAPCSTGRRAPSAATSATAAARCQPRATSAAEQPRSGRAAGQLA